MCAMGVSQNSDFSESVENVIIKKILIDLKGPPSLFQNQPQKYFMLLTRWPLGPSPHHPTQHWHLSTPTPRRSAPLDPPLHRRLAAPGDIETGPLLVMNGVITPIKCPCKWVTGGYDPYNWNSNLTFITGRGHNLAWSYRKSFRNIAKVVSIP